MTDTLPSGLLLAVLADHTPDDGPPRSYPLVVIELETLAPCVRCDVVWCCAGVHPLTIAADALADQGYAISPAARSWPGDRHDGWLRVPGIGWTVPVLPQTVMDFAANQADAGTVDPGRAEYVVTNGLDLYDGPAHDGDPDWLPPPPF